MKQFPDDVVGVVQDAYDGATQEPQKPYMGAVLKPQPQAQAAPAQTTPTYNLGGYFGNLNRPPVGKPGQ